MPNLTDSNQRHVSFQTHHQTATGKIRTDFWAENLETRASSRVVRVEPVLRPPLLSPISAHVRLLRERSRSRCRCRTRVSGPEEELFVVAAVCRVRCMYLSHGNGKRSELLSMHNTVFGRRIFLTAVLVWPWWPLN